jgi:hypothetical protein
MLDTTTSTTTASIPTAPATAVRTLDDLAALDVAQLEALYRTGKVTSLHALDGSPVCRMLSIRGLDKGATQRALRNFAAASFFPWAGKSFEAKSDGEGSGINRIRLGGGLRWFPFQTRVEPSAIDGAPCILLDYDHAPNPKPIRMIRDELREVAPGLFLGPAMLDTGKGDPKLLLFFACDCSGN